MATVVRTVARTLGKTVRVAGQAVDTLGVMLQGGNGYVEKLVPSTRVVGLKGKEPDWGMQAFVARSATLVGDVSLGELASVWYGATVRGDKGAVRIGRNSTVQDNVVIESAAGQPATSIGDDVTVAPGAYLSSCTIEDGAMIGMGAKIMPGATIGKDSFVDAGSVVPAGTVVPGGQLWTGNPARHLRDLSVDEMAYLRTTALANGQLAQKHQGEAVKGLVEQDYDLYLKEWREWMYMKPEDPLPEAKADVVSYYNLSRAQSTQADQGIFRIQEYDDAEARERKEAEELEADLEEEQYYQNLATLEKVNDAVMALSRIAPNNDNARRDVIEHLASRDERASLFLQDLMERALTADAGEVKEELTALDVRRRDPSLKGVDTELHYETLVEHAEKMKKLGA